MKSPLLLAGLVLLAIAIVLGIYAFSPDSHEVICVDCLVGDIGGGCTYVDKNGAYVQPEMCMAYDKSLTVHECEETSRDVDACIEIYQPVCGNDAKTYPNSCFACMNEMVSFYLEGDCSEVKDQKYCDSDRDCACGVHVETGECFYGNKDYVDVSEQCPDFCTGIAGNLVIKCIESDCAQIVPTEKNGPGEYCEQHSDCETPMEFLIQSNCPFGSACIENVCRVVCPLAYHYPDPNVSASVQYECTQDSDCDCSERGERSIECRCVDMVCLSVEG